MRKMELKVINTVKIQTIIDGKKTTRRRFNFEVELPDELEKKIHDFIVDVWAEVHAERRTPKEWVALINKNTRKLQLRGWAASIIWWEYGGNSESVLYDLSKTYNPLYKKNTIKQVTAILERMNCPKIIRNLASGTREAIRSKTIRDYLKKNEPIKLGVKK